MFMKSKGGFVVWLTWLSWSWKTTIAHNLSTEIENRIAKSVQILDGDVFRGFFSAPLGFSKEDRYRNLETANLVATMLSHNDVPVIWAFISPYEELRNNMRKSVKNYIEVYVSTPLEVCEKRDTKWLYKKARAGEIKLFTWINDIYEVPISPDLVIDTSYDSISESTEKILQFLQNKELI